MTFLSLKFGLLLAAIININNPTPSNVPQVLKEPNPMDTYNPFSKLEEAGDEVHHPYLYKVISVPDWQNSQQEDKVALGAIDQEFIHLATERQLDKIIKKYWKDESRFVILKMDTNKLKGKLVFETNPGGTSRYFHLYEGYIPFDSIVDGKLVVRKQH